MGECKGELGADFINLWLPKTASYAIIDRKFMHLDWKKVAKLRSMEYVVK